MKLLCSGGAWPYRFTDNIIYNYSGHNFDMGCQSSCQLQSSRQLLSFTKHDHKRIKTVHKLEITLKSIRYNNIGYICTSINWN